MPTVSPTVFSFVGRTSSARVTSAAAFFISYYFIIVMVLGSSSCVCCLCFLYALVNKKRKKKGKRRSSVARFPHGEGLLSEDADEGLFDFSFLTGFGRKVKAENGVDELSMPMSKEPIDATLRPLSLMDQFKMILLGGRLNKQSRYAQRNDVEDELEQGAVRSRNQPALNPTSSDKKRDGGSLFRAFRTKASVIPIDKETNESPPMLAGIDAPHSNRDGDDELEGSLPSILTIKASPNPIVAKKGLLSPQGASLQITVAAGRGLNHATVSPLNGSLRSADVEGQHHPLSVIGEDSDARGRRPQLSGRRSSVRSIPVERSSVNVSPTMALQGEGNGEDPSMTDAVKAAAARVRGMDSAVGGEVSPSVSPTGRRGSTNLASAASAFGSPKADWSPVVLSKGAVGSVGSQRAAEGEDSLDLPGAASVNRLNRLGGGSPPPQLSGRRSSVRSIPVERSSVNVTPTMPLHGEGAGEDPSMVDAIEAAAARVRGMDSVVGGEISPSASPTGRRGSTNLASAASAFGSPKADRSPVVLSKGAVGSLGSQRAAEGEDSLDLPGAASVNRLDRLGGGSPPPQLSGRRSSVRSIPVERSSVNVTPTMPLHGEGAGEDPSMVDAIEAASARVRGMDSAVGGEMSPSTLPTGRRGSFISAFASALGFTKTDRSPVVLSKGAVGSLGSQRAAEGEDSLDLPGAASVNRLNRLGGGSPPPQLSGRRSSVRSIPVERSSVNVTPTMAGEGGGVIHDPSMGAALPSDSPYADGSFYGHENVSHGSSASELRAEAFEQGVVPPSGNRRPQRSSPLVRPTGRIVRADRRPIVDPVAPKVRHVEASSSRIPPVESGPTSPIINVARGGQIKSSSPLFAGPLDDARGFGNSKNNGIEQPSVQAVPSSSGAMIAASMPTEHTANDYHRNLEGLPSPGASHGAEMNSIPQSMLSRIDVSDNVRDSDKRGGSPKGRIEVRPHNERTVRGVSTSRSPDASARDSAGPAIAKHAALTRTSAVNDVVSEEAPVLSGEMGSRQDVLFAARRQGGSSPGSPVIRPENAKSAQRNTVVVGEAHDVDDANAVAKPRSDNLATTHGSIDQQPVFTPSGSAATHQTSALREGPSATAGTAKRRISTGLVGAQLAVRSIAAFRGSFTDNGDAGSPNSVSPKPSEADMAGLSPNASPNLVRRKSAANIIIDADAIEVVDDYELSPKAAKGNPTEEAKSHSPDASPPPGRLGMRRRSSFSSPKGLEAKTGKEFKSYVDDEADEGVDGVSVSQLSPIHSPKPAVRSELSQSPLQSMRRRGSFSAPKGVEGKAAKGFRSYLDESDEED